MKYSFTTSSDPAIRTFIIAHTDATFYLIICFLNPWLFTACINNLDKNKSITDEVCRCQKDGGTVNHKDRHLVCTAWYACKQHALLFRPVIRVVYYESGHVLHTEWESAFCKPHLRRKMESQ